MSEVEKAAEKYAIDPIKMSGCPPQLKETIEHNRWNAFLAGAAWQREQLNKQWLNAIRKACLDSAGYCSGCEAAKQMKESFDDTNRSEEK